ncbi:hypothetical protein SNE25_04095 [Mucilaginibacter sabulilitoris]|uniref:Uncharacterized protein n=1 Tax=Mucilaginibacter sabulilitoris TaxID=1173583 RepID=A0ABZ0TTC1_9SPHI|nr:hypothetical protein [Mucilaginibacter sabulilitoris]WPU94700.1 hypothetical protein SNE25_04095 [Mucilaginibacter sabulilitoris]
MKTQIVHHTTLVIGAALIVTALVIRTAISRRRFNRRSITGLQLFQSFWHWRITTLIESFLNFTATLMLLAGVFLTACGIYTNH